MSKAQRRYCTTDRELLAVVQAVKHFKHYLYGRHFLIRTDHGALKWLLNFRQPEGKIARWLTALGTFDFSIEHRAGSKHGNADGLSRRPRRCKRSSCPACYTDPNLCENLISVRGVGLQQKCQLDSNLHTNWLDTFTDDKIREWQTNDAHIAPVIAFLHQSPNQPNPQDVRLESVETRKYLVHWHSLILSKGLLYRKWVSEKLSDPPVFQLCVPTCMRKEIFHHLHSLRTSGHLGSVRTFKNIRARFYWPGYKKDVLRWCKFCKPCAATKMRHGAKLGDLRQQLSGAPMERIAMDFIGPLPRTAAGNEHLLVVCDYFTKWVECFPLPDQTASVTADVLVTQFFSRLSATYHSYGSRL